MKTLVLMLSLAVAATGSATGTALLAQSPAKTATTTAADKVLMLEVTVPAPIAEVWKAFTTSEGLSTWLTPSAVVDLREGGEWTAHFRVEVQVAGRF